MIPSDYIFINKIPLTATGKIDQLALPLPEFTRTKENEIYTEPKDHLSCSL
jgi:hypothetical protein